jgi:hypothetical protein
MKIELQSKLFKLRTILNRISDVSYAYKTLYNKYRINEISEEQARQLIKAYEDLISEVKSSIQNTEYGKSNSEDQILAR